MTARRIAAAVLAAVTLGLLWVAALTPLRAGDIAALDAEARRLGEEWAAATDDPEEADRLRLASNDAYTAARALEPPLPVLQATGLALLGAAGATALWPRRSDPDHGPDDAHPER